MKLLFRLLAAAMLLGSGAAFTSQGTDAGLLRHPPLQQPEYLSTVKDPSFGTLSTRITAPGRALGAGIICEPQYCTHRYSSAQAWNADQSLLVIVNGCNGLCFLDGKSYVPLFRRAISDECEWHPRDPTIMICMDGREVYTYAPKANVRTSVFYTKDYTDLQFGPYEGNPSLDGARIVVHATNRSGDNVAFAYDITTKHKFPDIQLKALPGKTDSCTISPTGRYVLCTQELPGDVDQAYIFSVDGEPVQQWLEHHRPGHGDMTVDPDGRDVYVGVSKSDPDLYHIIKRRLEDGTVTVLAPYGQGQHVSVRNISRAGWAFVTYAGSVSDVLASDADSTPFYQEVVAIRTDGSGEARRLVATRNAEHDYWSEPHASPSPDGTKIIWSSNWGKAGAPVSDYVTHVDWDENSGTLKRPQP